MEIVARIQEQARIVVVPSEVTVGTQAGVQPRIARCPVCSRNFRPRLLSMSAWDAVGTHIRDKARAGCRFHSRVRDVSMRPVRWGGFACPTCPSSKFPTSSAVWEHILSAPHPEIQTEDIGIPETSSAEPTRQLKRCQMRMFYGLASAGNTEVVSSMLAANFDPNQGGDDSYTPLMIACESGHIGVVSALLADPRCDINRRNKYGQTALGFAVAPPHVKSCQNEIVIALLKAPQQGGIDIEARCAERGDTEMLGGLTAAELARKAGNDAIADMLAEAARDRQLQPLRDALAPGGSAASCWLARSVRRLRVLRVTHVALNTQGLFDSTTARILSLFDAAGLELPRARGYGNDADLIMVPDGAPLCSVCMQDDVGAALVPCMHAQFCPACAGAIAGGQHATALRKCPVCRTHVTDVIRIYI